MPSILSYNSISKQTWRHVCLIASFNYVIKQVWHHVYCVSHLTFLRKQFWIFRIINYLDKGSIFNKGQGKKLSVRIKGFFNLSWTMKFVPDFCHTLSIGKNLVQSSWSKTNLKPFKSIWAMEMEIWDKIHGLRQIYLRPWPMLSLWQKSGTNFMVWDKFVSDFQCSFFYLSRTFRCLSSLSCLYRQQ